MPPFIFRKAGLDKKSFTHFLFQDYRDVIQQLRAASIISVMNSLSSTTN
ncbi:hypothetical protein NC651_038742 [Populus alba x Populus x berolinensis]|nr:hypothetical protein NC651_038742 [Populus alba x Populus x berolinensis]